MNREGRSGVEDVFHGFAAWLMTFEEYQFARLFDRGLTSRRVHTFVLPSLHISRCCNLGDLTLLCQALGA